MNPGHILFGRELIIATVTVAGAVTLAAPLLDSWILLVPLEERLR
jgi:hypothetical protein